VLVDQVKSLPGMLFASHGICGGWLTSSSPSKMAGVMNVMPLNRMVGAFARGRPATFGNALVPDSFVFPPQFFLGLFNFGSRVHSFGDDRHKRNRDLRQHAPPVVPAVASLGGQLHRIIARPCADFLTICRNPKGWQFCDVASWVEPSGLSSLIAQRCKSDDLIRRIDPSVDLAGT